MYVCGLSLLWWVDLPPSTGHWPPPPTFCARAGAPTCWDRAQELCTLYRNSVMTYVDHQAGVGRLQAGIEHRRTAFR
jgi:hypothetical protein